MTVFQDVARMTDDLAMDLDLDGPEKNVYVVNPQKPVNYNVSFYFSIFHFSNANSKNSPFA